MILTLEDVLEFLDGRGLILTDDELIEGALAELGMTLETLVDTD